MDASSLSVTAARDGHSCVLTISGDLELTTAAGFPHMMCQAVSSMNGHGERVVLDLSELAFLDVAGARALVAAVHAIPDGHTVTVRSISRAASRVLGVLGWDLQAPAAYTAENTMPRGATDATEDQPHSPGGAPAGGPIAHRSPGSPQPT